MRPRLIMSLLALFFACGAETTSAAATPAQKCQSGKNNAAGKYAYCRQKAEAKLAVTSDNAAYTLALQKCADKYTTAWSGLETKAGGACPSAGDEAPIQAAIDAHTVNIASALAGGTLSECANDLATCQGDLLTCQATQQGQRIQTGQTTCWSSVGPTPSNCAGTGQDGEFQKGLTRSYVDNGDGTITDARTGLMWEKLSSDGSIHDANTSYNWYDAFQKVGALNAATFAGHADWRLPNVNELQSLVDYGTAFPAVSAAFSNGCAPGCTVLTCSCVAPGNFSEYWSSTSYSSQSAWFVSLAVGVVSGSSKTDVGLTYARAVRGGQTVRCTTPFASCGSCGNGVCVYNCPGDTLVCAVNNFAGSCSSNSDCQSFGGGLCAGGSPECLGGFPGCTSLCP
jgi:hypothetical protein